MNAQPLSVDHYIAAFPVETRVLLEEIRATILEAAPGAEETISYAMPAYKLEGMLVYFAGYKGHIGFYPGAGGIAAFFPKLAEYKHAKGSVQFPLDQPLPLQLVRDIVQFRVQQNQEKSSAKKAKKS